MARLDPASASVGVHRDASNGGELATLDELVRELAARRARERRERSKKIERN